MTKKLNKIKIPLKCPSCGGIEKIERWPCPDTVQNHSLRNGDQLYHRICGYREMVRKGEIPDQWVDRLGYAKKRIKVWMDAEPENPHDSPGRCPFCGSENIIKQVFPLGRKFECRDCKKEDFFTNNVIHMVPS